MILVMLISNSSSGFSDMSKGLLILDFNFMSAPLRNWSPTPMLIGQVVPTLVDLLRDSVFFSGLTWYHVPPSDSPRYLDPVPKLNIERWQTALLNRYGSGSFFLNFINQQENPLLSTVTTSVQPTYQPILCSINGPNMLRSISILFVIVSLLGKLVCYMFLQAHSMPTFSPKDYPLPFFRSSGPVSTLFLARFRLRGVLNIVYLFWFG